MKLRKENLRLWKYIRSFTEEHPEVMIEPMEVSYTDIQAGNIEATVKKLKGIRSRSLKSSAMMLKKSMRHLSKSS